MEKGNNPYAKGLAERMTVCKVFKLICNADEIPEMRKKYCVSRVTCDEESGKATLRIIADKVLPFGAVNIKPVLGDFFPEIPNK